MKLPTPDIENDHLERDIKKKSSKRDVVFLLDLMSRHEERGKLLKFVQGIGNMTLLNNK